MSAKKTVRNYWPAHHTVSRVTGLTFPQAVEAEQERLTVALSEAEWELAAIAAKREPLVAEIAELETAIRVYTSMSRV